MDLLAKSRKHSFQLPSWLANNQPIPEELLAKRSIVNHDEYDDDEDDHDYHRPSAFYAFSFIDLSGENEDAWSINSSNPPNSHIRDEIKTCVETLHNCLNHFREINEQSNEIHEEIDENIRNLLNELIDKIENSIEKRQSNENETIDIILDNNLLNELITKKLTFSEYLIILDRLIDNKFLKISSQTGEDILNEIHLLAEQIEQYRTKLLIDHNNDTDFDNQSQAQFLTNTQLNYSVISFLQQSISMDMSLLTTNDLSNQNQSTILITSTQQTSNTTGKTADIGMIY